MSIMLLLLFINISVAVGQENVWSQKSNFSLRTGAISFSINGKVYAGLGYGDYIRQDFWEFNPASNRWTQKASFPGLARSGAVSFVIDDKGYVGLGTGNGIDLYRDFWEYNPATNLWTQVAFFPGVSRTGAVAFSVMGKGYVGLGLNEGSFLNDMWEFNVVSNTWTQKNPFSGTARRGAVGFSIASKGYIGTGTNIISLMKDFWEYNPIADTWSRKADFGGVERSQGIGFSINGKGYIGTGTGTITYRDFWEYDTLSNSWSQKADMAAIGRYIAFGCASNSKGYVGTGRVNTTILSDFWEYTPNAVCSPPISNNIITSPAVNLFCDTANPFVVSGSFPSGANGSYTYQWQERTNSSFYVSIEGAVSKDYITSLLTQTKDFRRIIYSAGCTDTSNSVNILVHKPRETSVTIMPFVTDTFCESSTVRFQAIPVNGGDAPLYQWKKNGNNVNNDGDVFSVANLQNADTISCLLTSNEGCVVSATSYSNKYGVKMGEYLNTVLYVVSSTSAGNFLKIYNHSSGAILGSIRVGNFAYYSALAVSPDNEKVYVTNLNNDRVYIINAKTKQLIDSITVGSQPRAIVCSKDGTRLYVANYYGNSVSVINTVSNSLISNIATGTNPWGLCLNKDNTKLYVSNFSGKNISVVNTTFNFLIQNVLLANSPYSICISPDDQFLYVTLISNQLLCLNSQNMLPEFNISLPYMPRDICVSPNGKKLFISSSDYSSLMEVNLTSRTVDWTFEATPETGPHPGNNGSETMNICLSPDGKFLYTLKFLTGSLGILNTLTRDLSYYHGISNPSGYGTYATDLNLSIDRHWIGNDGNWEDAANWNCGAIPDSNTKVTIDRGNVIVNQSTTIYSLYVSPGASVTLMSGAQLTVLH